MNTQHVSKYNINSTLTIQAKAIISTLSGTIIFFDEDDEYDGYNTKWRLYIVLENENNEIKKFNYSRTVNYSQSDNASVYEPQILTKTDEEYIDYLISQEQESRANHHNHHNYDDYNDDYDYDKIYNMCNSFLTQQATKVSNSFSGQILYIYEKYGWGDCDDMGPTEHMWSLYIVVKNANDITYHKYYREVFEMHGDKDKDVEYDEEYLMPDTNDAVFDNIKSQLGL
jgi:hypothetical protein